VTKLGRRRRWWLVVAVVLVVGGGATGAWLLTRDPSAASTPLTATVSTQTVQQTVTASGTVEPARSADLDFAVQGTVTGVYVKAGDHVQKGQVLAQVGTSSLTAARNAASASLDAAEEQLDQDEDDDASDIQLAADETAVVAARAGLEEAQQDLDDAALRATISGTVASVDLEVGDVVGGSASSASDDSSDSSDSSSQVSIVSTRDFVVSATVSSADVASVKKGLQARITPAGASQTVFGTVQEVGVVAQTSSSGAAVFPVTIEVTGRHSDLYAGTSADASIIVSQRDGVLVVPSRALQTDGDTTYVEKVVGDGTVKTTVTIGQTYGANTEVVSGLADGDVVQLPGFTLPQGGGTGDNEELPGGEKPPDGGQVPGGVLVPGPITQGGPGK
jgi:macrolide-specific efflux system membrane fusion protein